VSHEETRGERAVLAKARSRTEGLHQQKKDLRPADATRVRTGCVRPMHPVRPDSQPDFFSYPMRPKKGPEVLVAPSGLWCNPTEVGYTRCNQRICSAPGPLGET